jgi:endonuclease YncB( thermonuclease family)
MQRLFKTFIHALGLCSLLWTLNLHAEVLWGKVVKVADGDTITLLEANKTQHKIRLSGIDAPESKQAFGAASKKSLSSMVAGQTVAVQWTKQDKYNRKVGKVMLGDMDCNLEQLKRGMAWHYKKYEREQPRDERQQYDAAEAAARVARVGLWRDVDPIPPWDYRKARR